MAARQPSEVWLLAAPGGLIVVVTLSALGRPLLIGLMAGVFRHAVLRSRVELPHATAAGRSRRIGLG
jgi:hypothetical protein